MLTASQVRALDSPGRYPDRDGLYLIVGKTGSKSWMYRYQIDGRRREMGLGSYKHYSLADARGMAGDARKLAKAGTDPQVAREKARKLALLEAIDSRTFGQCAVEYIDTHKVGWRNPKHVDQWTNTLKTYAFPIIGDMPVETVTLQHVLQILQPIWSTKPETASRVRGRIENVLSAAIVQGYREGPNPALWRGNLSLLLPARSKVRKVKHHAAMPWQDVPGIMRAIRSRNTVSCRALEFTILTAARTGEVIGARWDEIDMEARTWTVPASRMKADRQHRVALSEAAVDLLKGLPMVKDNPFVFTSTRRGRHISNIAMLKYLKQDLNHSEFTVHGFRSSFRDWVAEATSFPGRLAETALAHALASAVEAAYQRNDLLEKRRELMEAWADYCGGTSNVIAINDRKAS